MKVSIKKQIGVTLLEVMMVIAIGVTFLYITIAMYYQYRVQLSQTQLLANVDQLFQGMKHFYQANCRRQYDINGNKIHGGILDPTNAPTNSPWPISIATSLLGKGFLASWNPDSLLVDASDGTDNGYYVQFNPVVQTMNTYACSGTGDPPACTSNPVTTPLDGTGTPPTGASSVVVWYMQVAVKLLDPTKQSQYALQMGASCVSSLSGGAVEMCNPTPPQGGYLVWERATSFISGNTSDLWLSEPQVKQFNMQYTNDNMQLLNNGTDNQSNYYNSANYLCGE